MSQEHENIFSSPAEILDALRLKLGAANDSEVARALGVGRAAASAWRVNRSAMSPEIACRAAEILHVDPAALAVACLAHSTREPEARAVLERAAVLLRRIRKKAIRIGQLLTCHFSVTGPLHGVAP